MSKPSSKPNSSDGTGQAKKIEAKAKTKVAYENYREELTKFVGSRCGHASDLAKEVVQDTFLSYYEHILKGGEVSHDRGFLYQIARSKLIDQFRRAKTRAIVDNDDDVAPSSLPHERVAIAKQSLQLLEQAILTLPEKTRVVFVLKTYENKKMKDIALICNMSLSSVEKHLADAYNVLRKKIGDFEL